MENKVIESTTKDSEKISSRQSISKKVIFILVGLLLMTAFTFGLIFYKYSKKYSNITQVESIDDLSRVPLNVAKSNATEAFFRSALRDCVIEAILYYGGNNNSFLGYKIDDKSLPQNSCDKNPIVRISPDGQSVVIFGKLCSDPHKYVCLDAKQDINTGRHLSGDELIVDERYVKEETLSCKNDLSSQSDFK